MNMKKQKPPALVVDNKLPAEPTEEITDEEIHVVMVQIADVHNRYPEIDALMKRARETDDRAMWCACVEMVARYSIWRDVITEKQREKLRMVKKKT
jgi:hypothetical protein